VVIHSAALGETRALRLALFTDTFTPQVNGVARTLERLVAAVEARGGAVRVETVEDPGAAPDARVVRWPSAPFWAYPQLRMSAPLRADVMAGLKKWQPTLVHATTPFGIGLAGRAVAKALRVPLVTSYHTAFGEYLKHYGLGALDRASWPYLRWFHNSGRRTFAPSRHVATQLLAEGFRDLRVWGRGVDPLRFHPRFRSDAMRERMGASPSDFVVAYVGRVAPEKQLPLAIEAMRGVMARHPQVRFAVAGDGPALEECRAMAPARSWFAGALTGEALASFYASADCFVFPSTTETFGNVVLEAMASGLPVVAPDIGATLEIANRDTAELFAATNAESLADAVERVLLDANRRETLRTEGARIAQARTWDAIWDGLFREYLEVAGGPYYKAA
jgi:glycosyltransferase involved in cell wall biosynthesis